MKKYLQATVLALTLGPSVMVWAVGNDDKVWLDGLKNQYYAGKTIVEDDTVVTLETPYRAEDPALVPISIKSKIEQTPARYIKKMQVFVDNNPYPFVGEFELSPDNGKADLAMRIRVNTYSNVRVIAELNNGELHMHKQFVKASGGCSAPIGADLDAAMQRLGKMKFRLDDSVKADTPSLAQLLISHPNITGMQMDQVTRFIKKSHFIEKLKVSFNDKPVLTAKIDIAISADPNFRFYFVPKSSGVLKAEISDISCESPTSRQVCSSGSSYAQTYDVKL